MLWKNPCALVVTALTFFTLRLGAVDWPMYLANPQHTSYNRNETQINSRTVGMLRPLWRRSLGAPLSAAATVVDGRVFAGDWDGYFHALDAASGAVIWRQFVGKAPDPDSLDCQPGIGVAGQAAVAGDTVYVAGGDSAIYALDRDTGAIRWRVALADPKTGAYLWSSITLSGNVLYAGIASLGDCPLVRGGLARIDVTAPSQHAIRYLVGPDDVGGSVWSTPALDEKAGILYVTTGDGPQDAAAGNYGSAMVALDAATLEIRASFFMPLLATDVDADWGSSPLLFETADGAAYATGNGKNGMMYVLNRPSLTPAWNFKLATNCIAPEQGCGSLSTPAFDGRWVFTGAGQNDADLGPPGAVYALDPVARTSRWTYAAAGTVIAPVTLTPGLVFVPTVRGLVILDALSGAELWEDDGLDGMYSQAVVLNGVVYTTSFGGDIVAWGLPAGSGKPQLLANPDVLTFRYTLGGPAPQAQPVDVIGAGEAGFTASSDKGWLAVDQSSGSTAGGLRVSVAVEGLAPGEYSGALTVRSTDGTGPAVVRVALSVSQALPALAPRAIVNSATRQPAPLAPGSLFSISADGLSRETFVQALPPWPTVMAGITVRINGIAAPLAAVGPLEINGQVPFEAAVGDAMLTVESNGAVSNSVPVTVLAAAPGIFVGEDGRAAAGNADRAENSPADPAEAGTVARVFFTGQGLLDIPLESGAAAPYQWASNALEPASVTVGGVPAEVLFCGLTSRLVGIAQVNFVVPDLPPGEYPVVVTIAGTPSNSALIAVGIPGEPSLGAAQRTGAFGPAGRGQAYGGRAAPSR